MPVHVAAENLILMLSPITSTLPHLRCDDGLEEGTINRTVSVLQYSE